MYSLYMSLRDPGAKPISFFELMRHARPFKTSDRRDKVFALIGIPTIEANPDCGECFFEPDYTQKDEDIYLEVARRFLNNPAPGLDMLGGVQPRPDSGNDVAIRLPSWVPDWTQLCHRSLGPLVIDGEERSSASKNLPASTPGFKLQKPSTLIVSGVQFDTITRVQWLCSRADFDTLLHSLSSFWHIWVHVDRHQPSSDASYPDKSGATLAEAFCWTITGGNDWVGKRLRTQEERTWHLADYEAFVKRFYVQPSQILPRVPVPKLWEAMGKTADARRFYEAACHACSHRNIFVTGQGYIGIGPMNLRVGDRVCVLKGAEFPYVLRAVGVSDNNSRESNAEEDSGQEKENQFEVVGETYVHGIMEGEVNCREDETRVRDFNIV
jgi:hypothetical protein